MSKERILALRAFINEGSQDLCSSDEISPVSYRENAFSWGRQEYLVLTDQEADALTEESILNSVWATRASFLQGFLVVEIPEKIIRLIQEEMSEDCNDLLKALLTNADGFVRDVILSDGRGNTLAGYDGEEHDFVFRGKRYYIYRIN